MTAPEDRGLVSDIGPLEIDWPRTIGYYGGIALGVSLGAIEAPLGIFIAAVPFFKLFNRPNSPLPSRMVSHVLDGAAKPVGGDGEATIRVSQRGGPSMGGILSRIGQETESIWSEARSLAGRQ